MERLKISYLSTVVIALFLLACQPSTDNPEQVKKRMKQHVEYLASDELKGRETGTEGEDLAADYIAKQYAEIGLLPKGTENYFQDFEFLAGKSFGENLLSVDGNELKREEDYFVMNFSGNGNVQGDLINVGFGISAPEIEFDDYENISDAENKIFLIDVSSPDGIHPHSKYKAYHDLRNRVNLAKEKGALAVILYNPGDMAEDPKRNYSRTLTEVEIPVVFIMNPDQIAEASSINLTVNMEDDMKIGKNVVAYLDKKSAHTVVVGAHYDHLGMGDDGSLYRGDKPEIHNGADDNASGTAVLIELARSVSQMKEIDQNFIFIAFSGEEKGLLGSNHFTDNPTIELDEVNYMINMDMVGRLDSVNTLTIFGVGTSPVWDSIVGLENVKGELNVVEKPDGVGPSDHTPFYLENIPVLHLFTGAHSDYHKPSDDSDKINYEGMFMIYSYLNSIISELKGTNLEFTKTKDSDNQNAPRFSVTLGVVPDYTFSGKGMRIDGVTDGRPAAEAGIKKGDVVIRMGDMEVVDMMAYMTALSMYKKGDSTRVVVKRGAEEVDVQVNF